MLKVTHDADGCKMNKCSEEVPTKQRHTSFVEDQPILTAGLSS